MRKIISFVHISLDGFVAGPNGEMNWITINQEIFDEVSKRIETTDTALYGRVTYEMMEAYWPTAADAPNANKHDIEHAAWYKDAHRIVLSKTLKGLSTANTTVISDNITDQINSIKQNGHGEILLFGSPTTTHALLDLGLIDGFWMFVNPVVLGEGIPLFKNVKDKLKLKPTAAPKQFTSGVTELSYIVDQT